MNLLNLGLAIVAVKLPVASNVCIFLSMAGVLSASLVRIENKIEEDQLRLLVVTLLQATFQLSLKQGIAATVFCYTGCYLLE